MMMTGGPAWLADFFAAIMLAVALYSAGRLVAARVWERPTHVDIDATHVIMGVAMAGMLVSDLAFGRAGFWEVLFGLNALWFAARTAQVLTGRLDHPVSHYGTHLVMAVAMVYMYVDPSTTGFVWLPLLFVVVLLLSGVWEVDSGGRAGTPHRSASVPVGTPSVAATVGGPAVAELSEDTNDPAPEIGPAPTRWLAPRFEAASHVAMCVTMGYMLVLML